MAKARPRVYRLDELVEAVRNGLPPATPEELAARQREWEEVQKITKHLRLPPGTVERYIRSGRDDDGDDFSEETEGA